MLQTIYLKPELQLAKHLVSLDAYNIFIVVTITEAFSEFIKIQILPAVSHISVYQSSSTSCNHYRITFAMHSHIIHAMKCLDTPYFTDVSFIPPCSSTEHFRRPIDYDYPAFITTFEMVPELSSIHHFIHSHS